MRARVVLDFDADLWALWTIACEHLKNNPNELLESAILNRLLMLAEKLDSDELHIKLENTAGETHQYWEDRGKRAGPAVRVKNS